MGHRPQPRRASWASPPVARSPRWWRTAPGQGDPKAADPIDRLSSRPDFQVLIYPGPLGIPDVIPADAPPAFLLVANDDRGRFPRDRQPVSKVSRAEGLPVEAHILARGGHGFNMGNRSKLESVKKWPDRLADWLNDSGILDPSKRPTSRPGR